jgi:formamidopyrimidine-DNA glycosylase
MPELPEVETVRSGLSEILKDKPTIVGVEVSGKALRRPLPEDLWQQLLEERILEIRRRAKFLLWDTGKYTIINHLGMTGSWRLGKKNEFSEHDHVAFALRDGRRLVYRDPRRFGLLLTVKRGEELKNVWLKNLGVEPLDTKLFTGAYLKAAAHKRSVPIKNLLMDQKIVVGIGNIYASEILFRAKIAPGARASRLSLPRLKLLVSASRTILKAALKAGGTTINDFRQAGGSEGYFGRKLKVYDKAGKPCPVCGEKIRALTHAGRSTYWCRACQAA